MTTALKLPIEPLESAGRVMFALGDAPVASTSVYGTPSLWRAAAQAAVGTSVGPSPTSRTFRFSEIGAVADAKPDPTIITNRPVASQIPTRPSRPTRARRPRRRTNHLRAVGASNTRARTGRVASRDSSLAG